MEKIGRVIQGGTTINISSYQENQQTTSRIRNIVDSVHAVGHLGNVLSLDYIIIAGKTTYLIQIWRIT